MILNPVIDCYMKMAHLEDIYYIQGLKVDEASIRTEQICYVCLL